MAAGGEPIETCIETRETEVEDCLENSSVLTVLLKRDTIYYIVPSFPIYSTVLVEIKVQWEDEDGSLLVFDTFARKCDLLDHQLPMIAKILFSYDNAFIIGMRYIFE